MKEGRFTKHEVETAIRVLIQSKKVRNWVKSQADFLGVDLDTAEGQEFFEKNARAEAERLIR